jgi:hypothetical protein
MELALPPPVSVPPLLPLFEAAAASLSCLYLINPSNIFLSAAGSVGKADAPVGNAAPAPSVPGSVFM